MYRKEIKFFMARAYGPGSYDPLYEKQGQDYPINYVRWTENRNMAEFLRLVSMGRIQLAPLITHQFPLDDAPKAYETIMDPSSCSLAVLSELSGSQRFGRGERLPTGTRRWRLRVRHCNDGTREWLWSARAILRVGCICPT